MNISGYPERVPPPRRQTQPDERYRERISATRLRHQDNKETLTAPGSLFYTSANEFTSEALTVQDEAPSPDWQKLHDELHEKIANNADEDCAFTLILPEAGEVDVTLARGRPVGWEISLRFAPQVCRWWQSREIQCRRQLSQSLAAPVRLRIEQVNTV
ncbi:type III secretion system HrpP C-terminal domain-containing protein [Erwinia tracheiphila]|uniref:Type III secretion system protein n=1 Tax=Erwinia tracheiphila TaxID=65700 RepID=A0A345CUU8_9GAMM|nr:type III secretion system HrpP C-terminal domain-containing protein [Erwinia tracheiphila]AXF77215.1 type III secretion system protein [Erwinia tracheiphila]UIA84092.1 type III secretion system HrpP C-terminal domain-containing protein [Erwinia tracheiphila]UIA92674.1 type III secretion system HrpP C-terminal domain-containing protein [Erwinia tracheiphila]